jgi:WD40 repeat protein
VLEDSHLAGELCISPSGDLVVATLAERRELGLWSIPEGQLLRTLTLGELGQLIAFQFSHDGERVITGTQTATDAGYEIEVRSWPLTGEANHLLTRLEVPDASGTIWTRVDPTGSRLAWADGRTVRMAPLEGSTVHLASATSVKQDRAIAFFAFDGQGRQLGTQDAAGTIRVWSLDSDPPRVTHTLHGLGGWEALFWFDLRGSMVAGEGGLLWDLAAPPDAAPLQLRHPDMLFYGLDFDPHSRWLVTSEFNTGVAFWPLGRPYPRALRGHDAAVMQVAFTPDGERLVSRSEDGTVRVWPVRGASGELSRILYRAGGVLEAANSFSISRNGSYVAIGCRNGRVVVVPLNGGPARTVGGKQDFVNLSAVQIGPEARLVATGSEEGGVQIWDLESGAKYDVNTISGEGRWGFQFTDDGHLFVGSGEKMRWWSLEGEPPRLLEEVDLERPEFVSTNLCDVDLERRQLLLRKADMLWIQDIDTFDAHELGSYGSRISCLLDAARKIVVTNDGQGTMKVGSTIGGEPHLLIGPEQGRYALSPDGQWIASGGEDDGTIRLWPMPDLDKPPLHTLPRSELIAKLKTLTNLQAVPDEESPTGWKIEVGRFPGWETVPTW